MPVFIKNADKHDVYLHFVCKLRLLYVQFAFFN